MSASVIEPSIEELRAWRVRVLARVRQSLEQLEDREAQGALTSEERNVLATVRGIDFLLDGVE